jgi:putative transposase
VFKGVVTLTRVCSRSGMSKPVSYKRHRFPPEIIAHAVWLYVRFPLSLRLVEEMLLERGTIVSYETIRRWALKFGPAYARRLSRKSPSRRHIWHLDEIVVTILGQKHWLWRAVDQDGYVLDEVLQSRRDTKAAKRLLKRLLRKQGGPPRRMITDKLGSYAAARHQIMPDVEQRSHKGLNNRAKNSHLPFRRRERVMQCFRSAGGLQRFVSVFSAVRNLFVPPRSSRSARVTHRHRLNAMAEWKSAANIAA